MSATLVEESDGNLQSTVSAAPPPVVAQPMLEKTDELFVLAESDSNRRRLCLSVGTILCCCILIGVGVGVGVTTWSDEDNDPQQAGRPLDPKTPSRQFYLVQWGCLIEGCTTQSDAPLRISCSNGGTLTVLKGGTVNSRVDCRMKDNSTQVCHVAKQIHRTKDQNHHK